jgi:hypothetical protein
MHAEWQEHRRNLPPSTLLMRNQAFPVSALLVLSKLGMYNIKHTTQCTCSHNHRPLVECSDLLQLPAALTDLKCCALLVEPAGPGLTSSSGGASLSDSRSGSSSHARPASTGYRVTWMNAAAQQLLACGRERGRSSIALSSSTASSSRDAGPSPLSRHLPLEELIPSARELPLKVCRLGTPVSMHWSSSSSRTRHPLANGWHVYVCYLLRWSAAELVFGRATWCCSLYACYVFQEE